METLSAYHGKQEIKDKYIARVNAHRAADELIKGATQGFINGGGFRGCAVACTMDKYDHVAYETEIGVSRIIARLEDGIFEGLPIEEAMEFPAKFLEAIPIGANLEMVFPKMMVFVLVDKEFGCIQFEKTTKQKKAIQNVAGLFLEWIKSGIKPDKEKFKKAAAYAAYAATAYAAATAADGGAYAAATATRSKWRSAQAKYLLKLLAESK